LAVPFPKRIVSFAINQVLKVLSVNLSDSPGSQPFAIE
jgi:hypothetical protein